MLYEFYPYLKLDLLKKKAKLGRKKDLTTDKVFEELTILLENNYDTQITLYDLISKMEERLQNSSSAAYSRMYMTKRLKEHFGENIVFTNLPGKKTVITFRKKASSIIHDFYKAQRCEDSEIEKLRLIRTAAELIKADAKMISSDLTQYPDSDDICIDKGIDFLPDSLKAFLQCLIKSKNEISAKVKIASIGQCLLQAMRPVGIQAPLVLGCGCKGNCSTRACTCVSNAMRCSVACENCKGSACSNAAIIDMQEEVEIVSEDEDLL